MACGEPKRFATIRVRSKMSQITQNVFNLVEPIAQNLGCTVVEVEYKKLPDGMHLIIYLDKKEGITLNDCENVHNAIDQPLDDLDPTNGASYILNVSSLGLDHNINTDRALPLALNTQVDANLFAPINGKKQLTNATLTSFTQQDITIEQNGKSIVIPRKQISKLTKHINF